MLYQVAFRLVCAGARPDFGTIADPRKRYLNVLPDRSPSSSRVRQRGVRSGGTWPCVSSSWEWYEIEAEAVPGKVRHSLWRPAPQTPGATPSSAAPGASAAQRGTLCWRGSQIWTALPLPIPAMLWTSER